ncbi:zinc metalloproteinase nas-13-like [Stomoxys calcitrans]|uniref:zinc metalloproteinase nas-13-like n=1 Tax=Stomoxys calcitrans TaxID=35570 RepID=UPI0027E2ECE9|nr:zinc metalloproteinase nas-13-like [Stomoxys calcitrans]
MAITLNTVLWLFTFVLVASITHMAPLDPLIHDEDEVDEILLDDMIIGMSRNAIIKPAMKWPKGIVRYKIGKEFDKLQVKAIKRAMCAIEAVSCVRFQQVEKNIKSYINIISEKEGCSPRVGYSGRVQNLNLSKNKTACFVPVIIMHELLHGLGFYHQHLTPDRDSYIKINWENIMPSKKVFFEKLANTKSTDFGIGYDLQSLMHYAIKGFSVNGLDTIEPLDKNATVGQHIGMSLKDIQKLNAMYNCATFEKTL